jgi:hypothetical protein
LVQHIEYRHPIEDLDEACSRRTSSNISFPNLASRANINRLKAAFLGGVFSLLKIISIASGASVDEKIIVLLLDAGALVRIPVVIFGHTRYFVLDTGTSVTTLDSRFADRLVGTGAFMTIKAIRARFRGKDGEGRSIQLVRGSQQIHVNITLKRVI